MRLISFQTLQLNVELLFNVSKNLLPWRSFQSITDSFSEAFQIKVLNIIYFKIKILHSKIIVFIIVMSTFPYIAFL